RSFIRLLRCLEPGGLAHRRRIEADMAGSLLEIPDLGLEYSKAVAGGKAGSPVVAARREVPEHGVFRADALEALQVDPREVVWRHQMAEQHDEQEFGLEDVVARIDRDFRRQLPPAGIGERIDLLVRPTDLDLLATVEQANFGQPRQRRVDRAVAGAVEGPEQATFNHLLDFVARRVSEGEDAQAQGAGVHWRSSADAGHVSAANISIRYKRFKWRAKLTHPVHRASPHARFRAH